MRWGEFSADVGAAGAVAEFGGHQGGPCVSVVEDIQDIQWERCARRRTWNSNLSD